MIHTAPKLSSCHYLVVVYLTMLPVIRLFRVERLCDNNKMGRMWNVAVIKRNLWQAYYPVVLREGLNKSTNDLKIVGVPSEIRTRKLPNAARKTLQVNIDNAGNLQISNLFYSKTVGLEFIHTKCAVRYSKELHLLGSGDCEFCVALQLNWYSSPAPLNANTYFFSHGLYNARAGYPKPQDTTCTDLLDAWFLLLSTLSGTPFLHSLASYSQLCRFPSST